MCPPGHSQGVPLQRSKTLIFRHDHARPPCRRGLKQRANRQRRHNDVGRHGSENRWGFAALNQPGGWSGTVRLSYGEFTKALEICSACRRWSRSARRTGSRLSILESCVRTDLASTPAICRAAAWFNPRQADPLKPGTEAGLVVCPASPSHVAHLPQSRAQHAVPHQSPLVSKSSVLHMRAPERSRRVPRLRATRRV